MYPVLVNNEFYWWQEKKCTTVSVEVAKTQHKYVIGQRGSGIAEILQKTGVSVEMPPTDSNTGTITLRGPQDKLGLGMFRLKISLKIKIKMCLTNKLKC